MFKRNVSTHDNQFAQAYFYLINNYTKERAIFLKNKIFLSDPKLEDPINSELVNNINELIDKVVNFNEWKRENKRK